MTRDTLEMVQTNRTDASSKVTKAIYAAGEANNAIENTISALYHYIRLSSERDTRMFNYVTSGEVGESRGDLLSAVVQYEEDLKNEYYPLHDDLNRFLNFIIDKKCVEKKTVDRLKTAIKDMKDLISDAVYFNGSVKELL